MTSTAQGEMVDILLVEDNAGDARLALEAMRDSKIKNTLHHVSNGEEAMAFLRKQDQHRAAPGPDLILLDLNLPRMDGRQVLAEIKADQELRRIPVVVFTVSSAAEDILKAYSLHANCYITKPIDLDDFMKVVRSIEDFWLTMVKLPSQVGAA